MGDKGEVRKMLEERRSELLDELEELRPQLGELSRRYNITKNFFDRVETQLAELDGEKRPRDKFIEVSQHAIMRYIERVIQIDTDRIRRMILTKDLRKQVAKKGDGTYRISKESDLVALVSKGKVVTVYYRSDSRLNSGSDIGPYLSPEITKERI